ncbi:3-phosphoshikimate 1-carboxyvinyltransferase [Buchnera aphidicola]|uniref:3-phosphoshikimate 1-carboxyvinyltransferase n=1 Tax=Buchnera aphidicola TaxID=9 RepID=UPI0031B72779
MKKKLCLPPINFVSGEIFLPGSKSISNRVLLLSALSSGTTILKNILYSDDVKYMLSALKKLGIVYKLTKQNTECQISGSLKKFIKQKNKILYLGNAGTAMRPLTAILSLNNKNIILTGDLQMQKRPINHLVDALRQGGVNIQYLKNINYPPIQITGNFIGGIIKVNGTISSQFLSSLLLMAPLAPKETNIFIKGNLVSKPYIDLTIKLIKKFGVKIKILKNYIHFQISGNQIYKTPKKYFIEGDATSATYFLAAAAIKGGTVTVHGLPKNSIQGDKNFYKVLKKMGANIRWENNSIICTRNFLTGITIDLNDMPDAAMTIAILGVFTDTPVKILNIYNWRVKETDRLKAMSTELKKIGAKVIEGKDFLYISRPKKIFSSEIETYNDHRIAMCFSLIALAEIKIIILNPQCVNKTFPKFFKKFSTLYQKKKIL